MISVIVPSNRVGGMDLLFDSLERQTFRDFELIVVDNIYPHRDRLFYEHAAPRSFRARHVAPRDATFPAQAYCQTMNTGIAHARGEVCLFLCDYSFLSPTCIETHARLQREHNAPVTLDYRYVALPPLRPGLPHYRETVVGTEENAMAYRDEVADISERYAADVRSGRLDSFMWSIFAEPVTAEYITNAPVELEHKPSGADLANDWNYCSFKNESFPTELLLDMNGLDEEYDRSHGWQDSELSYRLRERGVRWHSGAPGEGLVTVVNPRHIMNIKNMPERLFYNRDLCFDTRRAELRLPVNPGRSLREWRAQ